MLKKRGQLTLFIILGIILIILSVLFFYLSFWDQIESPEKIIEEIPAQLLPLKQYIEGCIESTAKQAIILIGESGGYINVTEAGIMVSPDPTESEAVMFSPESSMKVAYWWHMSSSNQCSGNCEFRSEMPDLRSEFREGSLRPSTDFSIEAQIDRYVASNIEDCFDNFRAFKDQGFSFTELDGIEVTTTIRENDVFVEINYPLEVSRGISSSRISSFYAEVPVKLSRIYDLAFYIAVDQAGQHFLEYNTLNLIAGFSDISPEKLPPMAGSRFDLSSPVYWMKSEVKNNIESMLMSYTPMIQVEDTKNYQPREFDDPIMKRAYQQMSIPSYGSFNDLEADFTYLGWWPVYFDISSRGEIIMPDTAATDILPLPIGIQRYDFAYDLSYPVIVRITSPNDFHGRGYSFQIALESNIRNNRPVNTSFASIRREDYESSMFCDIDKRNTGEIKISASNAATGKPLENAVVYYSCGEESCLIGETELEDGKAVLRARLPICLGGTISIKKHDFIGRSSELSTQKEMEAEVSMALEPIQTKDIVIKKKVLSKNDDWIISPHSSPLSGNEEAIIKIERIGEEGEESFTSAAGISGKDSEIPQMRIARGKYSVSIQLYSDSRLVIPEEKKTFLFIPLVTIPEVEIEPFPAGGLILDEAAAFNLDRIEGYETIEFYALYFDLLGIPESQRKHQDLDVLSRIEEFSQHYRTHLEPRLK